LKDFKKFNVRDSPEIKKLGEEIIEFIFTRSQEILLQNNSVDTGYLLKSGRITGWEGDTIFMEYDAPHAFPVEYGSKPHFPPIGAIQKWVERKLGVKGKKSHSIAWAIAKKMEKKGTEPRPFIRPSIDEAIVRYNLSYGSLSIGGLDG